jgi:hypothetical protein
MGHQFIDRSLRTSGIVHLILLPFGLYYLGVWGALAVFSGAVWGILNLIFISRLIQASIRPDGVQHGRVIGLALIKFPLLYGSGFCLLKISNFDPLMLVVGFSSTLGIIALKAMGRALVDPDNKKQNSGELEKVI